MLETWKFLTARFFNHLDASYASVRVFEHTFYGENNTLTIYLFLLTDTAAARDVAPETVRGQCNQDWTQGKGRRVLPAARRQAERLGGCSRRLRRGLVEPLVHLALHRAPESDPYFQVFFSQSWLEAFVTSFRNFLSLVFRNLPLPKLLAFQLARLEEPTLKLRLKVSQSEATRLRMYNSEATAKIKKLEEAGRQLHSILRMMVQHNFMEHFSASTSSYVDVTSENRNKSRSRSRSYGAPTPGVGLSNKQMQEIESFSVSAARTVPMLIFLFLPTREICHA